MHTCRHFRLRLPFCTPNAIVFIFQIVLSAPNYFFLFVFFFNSYLSHCLGRVCLFSVSVLFFSSFFDKFSNGIVSRAKIALFLFWSNHNNDDYEYHGQLFSGSLWLFFLSSPMCRHCLCTYSADNCLSDSVDTGFVTHLNFIVCAFPFSSSFSFFLFFFLCCRWCWCWCWC